MRRRAFLHAAAAAFPFAALDPAHTFAAPPSPDTNPPDALPHPETLIIPNGQDALGETHSLGFSTILFKVLPRQTGQNLFLIEHKNLLQGGPPLHLHNSQDEWFYVLEGQVLFQLGGTRRTLGPGESVLGPRRVPHAFAGVGKTPAHMLIGFTPAGSMEAFFREAAIPNGPKMDAALFARHDMQYLGPPLTA